VYYFLNADTDCSQQSFSGLVKDNQSLCSKWLPFSQTHAEKCHRYWSMTLSIKCCWSSFKGWHVWDRHL